MKERIRQFALELGVDDVGFAAAADAATPRTPAVDSLLPGARTVVVLAYKELASCESPSPELAMNGRLDVMEFSRSCDYRVARFVEREARARALTVGASYPMRMSEDTKGSVGELSLRHAAVAAGLGGFGLHNLVLHPRMGSRVIFSAVLTDLEVPPDEPLPESPCTQCGACVENCPGRALDEPGRTAVMKCLRNSQPYGLGASIRFWNRLLAAPPEERGTLLRDPEYWRLYQAAFIGFQYFCFRCIATCPVGWRRA